MKLNNLKNQSCNLLRGRTENENIFNITVSVSEGSINPFRFSIWTPTRHDWTIHQWLKYYRRTNHRREEDLYSKHREGQGSASHLHKLLRRSEAADTQRYEDPAASVTAFRGILGQLLTDLTVDLISERNNRSRNADHSKLCSITIQLDYTHTLH